MAHSRNRPTGRPADLSSPRRTVSVMRDTYAVLNGAEGIQDRIDADGELLKELSRCSEVFATLPEDDPRFIAAAQRIEYLGSAAYRRRVRRQLLVKGLLRRLRQGLLLAAVLALRPLLVGLFNLVAFFLFVFFVLWLIS